MKKCYGITAMYGASGLTVDGQTEDRGRSVSHMIEEGRSQHHNTPTLSTSLPSLNTSSLTSTPRIPLHAMGQRDM